jgi:dihydroorotate dehydrogenase (fumarate)
MDLTTTYLGLNLEHPIVPSASPLSQSLDSIRRLEDARAPAIVMYSLFEEQIEGESHLLDHYLTYGAESFAEALNYFPEMQSYNVGPDAYLDLIHNAKAAVDIPIIGSLNGASTGGWVEYAHYIQEAGADALELNLYYIATDPMWCGAEVEQMYLDVVQAVKANVTIPVAVKVGPYFSSFANMAFRLVEAGADGLVIFNRFYQPDFDLDQLTVIPNLVLSSRHELRLPLRWVAILHGRVPASLAATSGIHRAADVLKMLMVGADVTCLCSVLMRHGVKQIAVVEGEMRTWMEQHEYESVQQLKGSLSQRKCDDPSAYERAQYMRAISSFPSAAKV